MDSPPQKRGKIEETPYTPIYSILPAEELPEQQGHSYRLQHISVLKLYKKVEFTIACHCISTVEEDRPPTYSMMTTMLWPGLVGGRAA